MKNLLTLLLFLMVVIKTEAQSSVFNMVDDLLLKGDYKTALDLLDNEQPKTFKIYDKTATIYKTTGNFNKAIEYYLKALALNNNEYTKVKLGNTYNTAGLTNNAVRIFEEIIAKDTTNLLVANSLGKLYLVKNKPASAEKIYTILKHKDAENPNYPYQLAKAFEKQHEKLKMGQSYLDAYNIDTLHLKSIYGLANFFKSLKYKDSTMLFIDKGLEIDSLNINFIQLKANELYFSKEFDKTITYLKRLDSLNFKSVNTYEMFGMSYLNLKEIDSAETYFRKALLMDRNNPKVLYRLGTLFYEQENFKSAKLYLMLSISAGKGDLDKQYYLQGIIAKEEQELKLAVSYFEKALRNNYGNYKALFELALASDIYFKDKKIALQHFQKYIERFESKDNLMTTYSNQRIKEIKTALFMDGEIVE